MPRQYSNQEKSRREFSYSHPDRELHGVRVYCSVPLPMVTRHQRKNLASGNEATSIISVLFSTMTVVLTTLYYVGVRCVQEHAAEISLAI